MPLRVYIYKRERALFYMDIYHVFCMFLCARMCVCECMCLCEIYIYKDIEINGLMPMVKVFSIMTNRSLYQSPGLN